MQTGSRNRVKNDNFFQARFDPTTNWTAELELKKDIYGLIDGWFVEWLQITTEQHLQFQCNFNIKLKRGLLGHITCHMPHTTCATSKNTTCALAGETLSGDNSQYFYKMNVFSDLFLRQQMKICSITMIFSRFCSHKSE